MGPTKVAATSSSLGCPRPSPNEAARTLSATAGQPNKNGQKLSKSAISAAPSCARRTNQDFQPAHDTPGPTVAMPRVEPERVSGLP